MAISDFFKRLFDKEEKSEEVVQDTVQNNDVNRVSLEIDEEDRIVVALAATAMAGKDKPDSHFHISRITRIK